MKKSSLLISAVYLYWVSHYTKNVACFPCNWWKNFYDHLHL